MSTSESKASEISTLQPKKSPFFSLKFLFISFFVLCNAYFVLALFPQTKSLSALTSFLGISNLSTENMASADADESWKTATNIYGFTAKSIDGDNVELSKYKGKVCLIVNVACACGLTKGNYPALEDLYKKYEPQGLSVLGFPCNQFGGQEPKPEAEIKEYIKQFDVNFDMFSKINVNGAGAHPLYKYLTSKLGGTFGSFIKWNFSKFLVDRDGVPVKRYSPTTNPKDLEEDIVKLLAGNSKV